MYFASFEVADGVIDQTMSGDGVFAGKYFGDDDQFEMAAFFRAGVAGMMGRLILDFQRQRLQDRQLAAQQRDIVLVQAGNTFLNGLTLTCW